jgi:4-carboxymuconolactone decarboxylase
VTDHRRPRIEPIRSPTGELAQVLASGWQHNGAPLNAAATLAHHPRLLKRFTLFTGLFLGHSLLPPRDRELITLRSAHLSGVNYYIAHHVKSAMAAGLSLDELNGITDNDFPWAGNDLVLIRAANELVAVAQLSDSTWVDLASIYNPAQLEEVLLLPGFYRMMAGFVNTIGVELEDGMPELLSLVIPSVESDAPPED